MIISLRTAALVFCTLFTLGAVSAAVAQTAARAMIEPIDAQATKALHALFEQDWQRVAERYPEFSTYRGDLRYNDRLADVSPAAQAADYAHARQMISAARALPAERLNATDRVSRELFIRRAEDGLALEPHPGYRSLSLGALGGTQSDLSDLLRVVPMSRVQHVEQLVVRLATYPKRMDQEIANLGSGMAAGWVAPRAVLDRVLLQIDGQLPADVEAGPFYEPFKRLGADIPAAERGRLQAAGRAAIEQHVLPSLRKLRAFVTDEYLPKAPASGAMLQYRGGKAVYDILVRQQTTTDLTAAQVHAIGLREMVRTRAEMEGVMRQVKFDGDFPAFIRFLNTDPRFFVKSPEELLAIYRDLGKRLDAEMPRLFAELPRAPWGVRAMPAHMGTDAAESYESPARDGSRPGWFNANVLNLAGRPTWGLATLTAHEAVPGHHLQIARALELGALPEFRRSGWGYTAYVEGWALYAETLGREIGLYDDPYALFGHLQWQAFRAARLVVDTGLHSLGWSRRQAIDYMVERTGVPEAFVAAEVDRYISWPGQALAYMVGQLKIVELRARAKAALGDKLDLRRFHNAVLDNGALPLATLETLIDTWIAGELATAKAPA